MGVLNKFLNVMKLNDDEDMDDEEFLDDEVDDFEEERPKKRLFKSRDEDDDDDDDDEDDDFRRRSKSSQTKNASKQKSVRQSQSQTAPVMSGTSSSKVSPIRPRKKSNMAVSGEIMVLKPRSLNDAYQITQALWNNCTVILNLEEAPTEEAQRIVDFSSGTCFALSGRIEQISPSNNKMLVITPETVELSGDFQERMGTALDVHSRF